VRLAIDQHPIEALAQHGLDQGFQIRILPRSWRINPARRRPALKKRHHTQAALKKTACDRRCAQCAQAPLHLWTHDDITADSIAKAFGVPIDVDQRALAILHEWLKATGAR
jgi:hypothetical protein